MSPLELYRRLFELFQHSTYNLTTMQAYEFNAEIHDGIIKVPKRFWSKTPQKSKVIFLTKDLFGENRNGSPDVISELLEHPIQRPYF